jgi:hypothetical protein
MLLRHDNRPQCRIELRNFARPSETATRLENSPMARTFHPSFNTISRVSVFGLVLVVCCAGWIGWKVQQSPYVTSQEIIRQQPVPFSHEHHVGRLGIDCRYCHSTVTESAFAGIPPTKTCMTCHSQIWTNAAMLEPVRESWSSGRPLVWQRVNNLPDYVYFDHSIHVNKGVGCATCHGAVDQMPLMWQAAPLTMSWCMDCHREPEKYLRPRDRVFDMNYQSPEDQLALGQQLVERYQIRSPAALTDCFTCHR